MSNFKRTSIVEVINERSNSIELISTRSIRSKNDEPVPRLNSNLEQTGSITNAPSSNVKYAQVFGGKQRAVVEITREKSPPPYRGSYDHRRMSNEWLLEESTSQQNSIVKVLNAEHLTKPTDDSLHIKNHSPYELTILSEVRTAKPILDISAQISSPLLNRKTTKLDEDTEKYKASKKFIKYNSLGSEHILLVGHGINLTKDKLYEDKVTSTDISITVHDTKSKEIVQSDLLLHSALPAKTDTNAYNIDNVDNHIIPTVKPLQFEQSNQKSSQVQDHETVKERSSLEESSASLFQNSTSVEASSNYNVINILSAKNESEGELILPQENTNFDNQTSSIKLIHVEQHDAIVNNTPITRRVSATDSYNFVHTEQQASELYSPLSDVNSNLKSKETIHIDDRTPPIELVLSHFSQPVNGTSQPHNVTASDNDMTVEKIEGTLKKHCLATDDHMRQAVNITLYSQKITASDNDMIVEEIEGTLAKHSPVTDNHIRQTINIKSQAQNVTLSENDVAFKEIHGSFAQQCPVTDNLKRQVDDQKVASSDNNITLEEVQGRLSQRSSVIDDNISINNSSYLNNYISPIELTTPHFKQADNGTHLKNYTQTHNIYTLNEEPKVSNLSQPTITSLQIKNTDGEVITASAVEPEKVSQFNLPIRMISQIAKKVAIDDNTLLNKQQIVPSEYSPSKENISAHSEQTIHTTTDYSSKHIFTTNSYKPSMEMGLQVLDCQTSEQEVTLSNCITPKKEYPPNKFQINSTQIETVTKGCEEPPIILGHQINISPEHVSNLKMNTIQPVIITEKGISSERVMTFQSKPTVHTTSVIENNSEMNTDMSEEQQLSISQFSPIAVNSSTQCKGYVEIGDIPSEGKASLSISTMSAATTEMLIQETKHTKNRLFDKKDNSNISDFSSTVVNISNVQNPILEVNLRALSKFKPTVEVITHGKESFSINKSIESE